MNVQFEDQQNIRYASGPKGLAGFVIKSGLAKDAKGAQVVLLIIAVLAFIIAGFFIFTGGGEPTAGEGKPLPVEQIPE